MCVVRVVVKQGSDRIMPSTSIVPQGFLRNGLCNLRWQETLGITVAVAVSLVGWSQKPFLMEVDSCMFMTVTLCDAIG